MADRVYLRHSTDEQTDARQRHALAALIAAGAPVYDDPATSSRRLSLDRVGSPSCCTRPPSATPSASPTPPACSARSPTSSPCDPC
ncbi:hypothetical protein AB0C21_05295 [Spirillospora sp. NPDC049024]